MIVSHLKQRQSLVFDIPISRMTLSRAVNQARTITIVSRYRLLWNIQVTLFMAGLCTESIPCNKSVLSQQTGDLLCVGMQIIWIYIQLSVGFWWISFLKFDFVHQEESEYLIFLPFCFLVWFCEFDYICISQIDKCSIRFFYRIFSHFMRGSDISCYLSLQNFPTILHCRCWKFVDSSYSSYL